MKMSEMQRLEKAKKVKKSREECTHTVYSTHINEADWRAGVQNLQGNQFITIDGDPVEHPQLAKFGASGFVMHYQEDTGYTLHHRKGTVALETIDVDAPVQNTAESVGGLLEKPELAETQAPPSKPKARSKKSKS